ncbi:hypothetical protein RQP46_008395 [Phenoliferia psychrophenolica]
MSDRLEDDRPAKKLKLEEPEVAAATPAAPDAAPNPFSWAGEGGLFGSLVETLGRRASTEPEVGISEYVDPDIPPFSGIIKHRFTDFLVFEVGMDGEVIRLKDIKSPAKPKAPPAEGGADEGKDAAPVVALPLWNDASEAAAKELIPEDKFEEFKAFVLAGPTPVVRGGGANATLPRRIFTTGIVELKDARTAIHRGLRAAFDSKFSSEARELTPGGEQVIDVTWAVGGGKKPRQSKAEKAASGGNLPPYIHFTLQKTNKEMHDALSGLCRTLNIQNRDIGTSGTKDKRAVTVQRVSIKRGGRTIEEVWKAANPNQGGRGRGRGRGGRGGWSSNGGTDRGVTIGDLAYSPSYLELGKLKGNKFVVTLRDVEADSPTTITRAISVLKERGFLNYYGMQRFGTAPIPTHAIGLALLRSDWALACHLLLLERDGEGDDAKLARIQWREGKFDDAVRTMPRRCVAEKAILEYYMRGDKTDHLSALSRIPKNLRMMYVHAYQSYVFNRVVSARVQAFGCSAPVAGDLVYEDGEAPATEEEPAAAEVEPVVVESLDPDLEDDAPSASAPRNGMTSDKAERGSKVAKVKVLTQADIDSGKYTIRDVILALPGYAVTYPAGKLGEMYREILASDKLNIDDMFRKQKEYSLGGTYRSLLYTPQDVTHRLLLYTNPNEDLAQSDEDALKNLSLPPTVPFSGEGPVPEGHHLALQIELTLGAGTFATMALREVLKTRTGSAHQKELTEKMEERIRERDEATAAPVTTVPEVKMDEDAPVPLAP